MLSKSDISKIEALVYTQRSERLLLTKKELSLKESIHLFKNKSGDVIEEEPSDYGDMFSTFAECSGKQEIRIQKVETYLNEIVKKKPRYWESWSKKVSSFSFGIEDAPNKIILEKEIRRIVGCVTHALLEDGIGHFKILNKQTDFILTSNLFIKYHACIQDSIRKFSSVLQDEMKFSYTNQQLRIRTLPSKTREICGHKKLEELLYKYNIQHRVYKDITIWSIPAGLFAYILIEEKGIHLPILYSNSFFDIVSRVYLSILGKGIDGTSELLFITTKNPMLANILNYSYIEPHARNKYTPHPDVYFTKEKLETTKMSFGNDFVIRNKERLDHNCVLLGAVK